MVELAPAARSPITPMLPDAVVAGWVVSGRRSSAALTLTDHTPLAKVVVKAAWDGAMAKTLAVPFGRSARQAWNVEEGTVGVLLTGSGPGEWLALAAPGQQLNVVEWFEKSAGRAAELVTVVDLTHGRALVRLTGQRSADVLAKECATDLSADICPDGSTLRSMVAGVSADVIRDDVEGVRSYLLHCERSSGQYLFDSLLDSGGEFGAEVDGFQPTGSHV